MKCDANIELKLLRLDLLWSACYCDICERGELVEYSIDDQWRATQDLQISGMRWNSEIYN